MGKRTTMNNRPIHHAWPAAWLIGLCAVLSLGKGRAQESWCAAPTSPVVVEATDPSDRVLPREVLTIQVVVHVVWRTPEENISDAQIQSQIEVLNRDYRQHNDNFLSIVTYPLFRQIAADMEIEFALATVDPTGQPTSGIVRRQTDLPQIASTFFNDGRRRISYDELGGSDAWPTDCYLNIWVGALSPGLAGKGTFPEEVSDREDGVFIAPHRFGTFGTVRQPYHLGRTATHEIGHFLNLHHLWGPGTDPSCDGDDGVADTPRQNKTFLNQCPLTINLSCQLDLPAMTSNFMGLSEDACLAMFTEGQKARVWETLNGPRRGLLHPPAGCVTPTATTEQPTADPVVKVVVNGRQLRIDWASDRWSAQLFDLAGRPLWRQEGLGRGWRHYELPELPAGLYLLHVRGARAERVKKLIIAHP